MEKFTGAVNGFHGPVEVELAWDGGKITSVETNYKDSARVGALTVDLLADEIIQKQSVDLDALSGATISSQAVIDAAKKAKALKEGQINQDQAQDLSFKLNSADSTSAASGTNGKSSNVEEAVLDNGDLVWSDSYDILVVGSGAGGLSAAVSAAQAGSSVLVLEKAGIPGGTTNYSGGVIQAGGTSYQKDQTDSGQKHGQLYLEAGEGCVDKNLVEDLTANAASNIEWLAEMGIEWESTYSHTHIPYISQDLMSDRIHVYKNGGGSGDGVILIKTLLEEAQKLGGKISYKSEVTSLVKDSNAAITGVKVNIDSEIKYIQAKKAVIIATSGIDHNWELSKALNRQNFWDLKNGNVVTMPTNTGDGLLLGMSVGASIGGFGGAIDFCGHTGNATSDQNPTFPCIFVNGQGLRFVCEDATYGYGYRAIFQAEKALNHLTYMVFSDSSLEDCASPWDQDRLSQDIKSGRVIEACSIEELAEKIGVPGGNLASSVDRWNKYAEEGFDPDFNRKTGVKPLKKDGKFYALENIPMSLGAIGGLSINTNSQVLDIYGQPIENLYAAGMCTGGWIGEYYPGSGTAISGAVHQGRRAGAHASK